MMKNLTLYQSRVECLKDLFSDQYSLSGVHSALSYEAARCQTMTNMDNCQKLQDDLERLKERKGMVLEFHPAKRHVL